MHSCQSTPHGIYISICTEFIVDRGPLFSLISTMLQGLCSLSPVLDLDIVQVLVVLCVMLFWLLR